MKKTIIYGLTILLIMLNPIIGFNQTTVPTIKAKSNKVSVRLGSEYYSNAWEITPNSEKDADETGAEVAKEGSFFAFITDVDSIGFVLKRGESRAFCIVLNEKDTVWARAKGRTPKADFDEAYRKANDGKTLVEVPAVYELINIVMAITPTGVRDSDLVEHNIPYYNKVQTYFGAFKNHKAVSVMDSLLKANQYYDIKMDSYSHDFEKGKLVKKAAYNRIAWGKENTIVPYVSLFEDFAKKTKFSKFYKKNKPYYDRMIRAYRDSLGVPQMQTWLNLNFPASQKNCIKIIFSPLVNANQSATSFDNDGFNEHQAHVDCPNFWYNPKTSKLSEQSVNIKRGNIVFTELNHGFENPEFENKKNRANFNAIKLKLDLFKDKTKNNGYNNPLSCVQEYMNWALVSLRFMDMGPKEDWEIFFTDVENNQQNRRGFIQFKAFNRFLIKAYQERAKGQTVADLYPQIIKWFGENNK
jgi:Domain of unknown function (DUF4932)